MFRSSVWLSNHQRRIGKHVLLSGVTVRASGTQLERENTLVGCIRRGAYFPGAEVTSAGAEECSTVRFYRNGTAD